MKGNKRVQDLRDDQLDGIATYAGCLQIILQMVGDQNIMPFFREELARIETAACDELVRRGVVADFFDDEETQPFEPIA